MNWGNCANYFCPGKKKKKKKREAVKSQCTKRYDAKDAGLPFDLSRMILFSHQHVLTSRQMSFVKNCFVCRKRVFFPAIVFPQPTFICCQAPLTDLFSVFGATCFFHQCYQEAWCSSHSGILKWQQCNNKKKTSVHITIMLSLSSTTSLAISPSLEFSRILEFLSESLT